MDAWQLFSPDSMMHLFNLSGNLAHSPDYHFYKPLDFEYSGMFHNNPRLQFLGFIRPAKKYEYVSFRFWKLYDEWITSDANILLPGWSGRIDIYHSEIDDLITLLRAYGHTIRDIDMKNPMFQLIPREDYEKFHIDKSYLEKDRGEKFYNPERQLERIKIYLCSEPMVDDHDTQVQHKIVALGFEAQKISLRVMFTPKQRDPSFAFHNGWIFGGGWLNLTKQGIEEFCQLLLNKP